MNDAVIIDVREIEEFKKEHISSSINIPLSGFAQLAPGVLSHLSNKNILIMCQTGLRSQQATTLLKDIPSQNMFEIFQGGIEEWKRQGNPTSSGARNKTIPIMRQVLLTAGLLIFLFSSLALFAAPAFAYVVLAIGAGLTMAGLTGFCPMAMLLAKMPWNR